MSFGDSPLAFALDGKWKMEDEKIKLEIMKLLIGAGADLEERNCHNNLSKYFCGPTPLYFASVRSYLSVVSLLVESGANIWFKHTPYWLVGDMTPWYIWAGWENDLLDSYYFPQIRRMLRPIYWRSAVLAWRKKERGRKWKGSAGGTLFRIKLENDF
eukprot:GFUD01063656.1.p1 GENE.GFUD01063656.1~~GFUD01063656.1.p1  ORF type:complete len:157 (-),score=33.44 GFUD01063656.1:37-507(-)